MRRGNESQPTTHAADAADPELVPALDAFVSESALPRTPSRLDQPTHPLWQFPEERRSVSGSYQAVRQVAIYAALVAAVLVSAIVGAWWGRSFPSRRPIADPPIAQAVVNPPVVQPPDVPSDPPAELISSVKVEPSTHPPVASVLPAVARRDFARIESPTPKPVAPSARVTEQRQRPQSTNPVRGTSGGARDALRQGPITNPSAEPNAAPPMVATNSAVGSPVEASTAQEIPSAPPPPRVPAAMRPEPEALPSVVARTEQSEIQRALGQYRSAYQLLDAEAARAVWPSVNVRALSRAFDSLASQRLQFDDCQFEIAGEAATAQCRGSATYTPKVGNRVARLEPRQWTFQLRKMDEGWKIQSAQARR